MRLAAQSSAKALGAPKAGAGAFRALGAGVVRLWPPPRRRGRPPGPPGPLAGLRFGFLEDPLCKVFALSKLLRKTPCSGLEPGKPLFQRFSWLRFFCIVKFTLFFCGVCPQNRKVAPQATFLAPQAKLFGPERWGARKSRFFWHSNRELFK